MSVMKCSVCGKPIMNYWAVVARRNICVPCAQSTTIWDLVIDGTFNIMPDIAVEFDGEKRTYGDTDSNFVTFDVKSSYPAEFVEKAIATNAVEKIAATKEALNNEFALNLDPDKNLPENVEFMETEDDA